MKTELRVAKHSIIHGAKVVELWYGGMFIGQITGTDGPGVRIMSKHGVCAQAGDNSITIRPDPITVPLIEVKIGVES